MTDKNRKALYIAEQCRRAGMTLAGAAGAIASVEAESAFKSTNLQDSYEKPIGMTDEQYTMAVDNGTYHNFTGDAAGYGLCQWTASDRKAKMLAYFRSRGASIGDFATQVDFMIEEMHGYSKAWATCTTSDNPYECGYAVCRYYEIPADTENQAQYRGGRAQHWYSVIAASPGGEETVIPVTPAGTGEDGGAGDVGERDEDGNIIEKTWPPRMLQKGRCSGWPEVKLLQAAIRCRGYNALTDGIFGDALEEKVKQFQKDEGLDPDGIVGPKTWDRLFERR